MAFFGLPAGNRPSGHNSNLYLSFSIMCLFMDDASARPKRRTVRQYAGLSSLAAQSRMSDGQGLKAYAIYTPPSRGGPGGGRGAVL